LTNLNAAMPPNVILPTGGLSMARRHAAIFLFSAPIAWAIWNTSALADVPFAFAYYYMRGTLQWSLIPLCLLIELLVLRYAFQLNWVRSIICNLLMNLLTTVLGLLGISYLINLEIMLSAGLYHGFREIAVTVFLAALIDTIFEYPVIWIFFSRKLTVARISALFLGNLASAIILLGTYVVPLPR
jgi:hypothetical protein